MRFDLRVASRAAAILWQKVSKSLTPTDVEGDVWRWREREVERGREREREREHGEALWVRVRVRVRVVMPRVGEDSRYRRGTSSEQRETSLAWRGFWWRGDRG